MTFTETAFLCAIFALYLSDCIYWVGQGEQAFTRSSANDWRARKIEPLSFTLLGKMPLVVAPFIIRPAFIRTPLKDSDPSPRRLRKVARRLDRLYLLLALCRAQAFLLLVYLPLLLILHRLAAVWPIFVVLLLIVHTSLSLIAIAALRRANCLSWVTTAISIALNPIGATRTFDALAQALFDQDRGPRPRASSLPSALPG